MDHAGPATMNLVARLCKKRYHEDYLTKPWAGSVAWEARGATAARRIPGTAETELVRRGDTDPTAETPPNPCIFKRTRDRGPPDIWEGFGRCLNMLKCLNHIRFSSISRGPWVAPRRHRNACFLLGLQAFQAFWSPQAGKC